MKPDQGDGDQVDERPLIEVGNDGVGEYLSVSDKEIEGVDFGFVQYSAISKRIDEEEEEESSEYDTDSDRAESSSPDASMTEIMPMLDELHPLLDSEPTQPVVAPDVASEDSHRSSDGSDDDQVENAGNEDAREKQGSPGAVVTWTEEDEKNLILLGNSELERNRRLESLIARRRARKNFRVMMAEKNLIDLDVGDPTFQIAPISTARRNPFDLHYDSNEGMDLPPIPGSAPSVLAPRRNPFDIPYDLFEERPNLAGGSFGEDFFSSHEKDNYFRRHESFSAGSSIFGEPRPLKPASKLRPFFVPELLHPEEVGYPTFQRQLSEISESKMSSVTETESVSSASDQDSHKNKTEEELSQSVPRGERELSQLLDHFEHAPEHVKLESLSTEVNLVDFDEKYHRNVGVAEREFTPLEMESVASPMGSDITVGSIITDVYVKCDVEEKYCEIGLSSSEMKEVLYHVNTTQVLETPKQTDNTCTDSTTQPSVAVSNTRNDIRGGGTDKDGTEQESSQPIPVEHAHGHNEKESSSSEEVDLVEFDQEYHRDALADKEKARERQSVSLEMKPLASPMGSDTTNVYLKPEVEEKHVELRSSSSSELIEMLHHVNTIETLGTPEPKTDDTIGSSSMQSTVEESNMMQWMEGDGSQMKEPVYDWNWYPSGVEKTLSGISIIEEALGYGDKKGLTSTSSDMPVKDPEVYVTALQVERTISFTDEDFLLHHENIEEETTSSNEGLCAFLDLPVTEENQLRLMKASMTGEHDVTTVEFPRDDRNDESLRTPVLSSITEKVVCKLSSSSSSSEAECENENSVTREVNVVDAAGLDDFGLLSEDMMMETPPTLLEKAMLHDASVSYHEEFQEVSSSIGVSNIDSDASSKAIHGDVGRDVPSHSTSVSSPTLVPSEISKNEPATREINFEDTLPDEFQHCIYSDDMEHSNFSQVLNEVEVTDKEFNEVDITGMEEGLLMELDAVGDFGTAELKTNTNQMEYPLLVNGQESLTVLQVHETDFSQDVGDESTVDSMEVVPDLQSSEPVVEGEGHLSSKKIPVDKMEGEDLIGVQDVEPDFSKNAEDQSQKTLDPMDLPPDLQSFEPIVGEVHSSLEQVSVDKVQNRSLTGLQVSAPESWRDVEKTMDPMQVEYHLQSFEPRIGEVHSTSEQLFVDEMEDKSLVGVQVHEPDSSKDVVDDSQKTIDSVEVLPDLQSFEPIVEGDVQLPVDEMEDNRLTCLQVHEVNSSKDVEIESHKTTDSIEVLPRLQGFEPNEEEEVYLTWEQLSMNEMEDKSNEPDSSKDVDDESHQTTDSVEVEEEVHSASKEVSVDKMEDKSLTGLQVVKPDSSKDVVDESHESIDSLEDESLSGLQVVKPDSETRVGQVHSASEEASADKMENESVREKVVESDYSKETSDSMEVVPEWQSYESTLEGDVHSTSKEELADKMEDELEPIKTKPDFEYVLSEDSKRSLNESMMSGVEETDQGTSSGAVVVKKKGSLVSKSSSSSSSSDSD